MTSWTRRQVLALALHAWAFSGLARPAAAAPARGRKTPRYVIVIGCHGGMDSILTTSPKQPSEVAPWVDVPYTRDDILRVGKLAVGPHLRPLGDAVADFALVNGVQVRTANHETGGLQLSRMKTAPHKQMPTLLDVLAAHRDGQPLGTVTLGALSFSYSPGLFFDVKREGRDGLFKQLEATAPADLERMARVAREHAERLERVGGAEYLTAASNMRQCADLMLRMRHIKPFHAADDWSGAVAMAKKTGAKQGMANGHDMILQRALWILENDLARGVQINAEGPWDSHQENLDGQSRANLTFFTSLRKFLDELRGRRSVAGPLADNTLVVISSDVGRFPALNRLAGKDHFPEVPYLFWGCGIRAAGREGVAFGGTDAQMKALPVALRDGKPAAGGHYVTLDDVGTTVLAMCGLNPQLYGYSGVELGFVQAR